MNITHIHCLWQWFIVAVKNLEYQIRSSLTTKESSHNNSLVNAQNRSMRRRSVVLELHLSAMQASASSMTRSNIASTTSIRTTLSAVGSWLSKTRFVVDGIDSRPVGLPLLILLATVGRRFIGCSFAVVGDAERVSAVDGEWLTRLRQSTLGAKKKHTYTYIFSHCIDSNLMTGPTHSGICTPPSIFASDQSTGNSFSHNRTSCIDSCQCVSMPISNHLRRASLLACENNGIHNVNCHERQ